MGEGGGVAPSSSPLPSPHALSHARPLPLHPPSPLSIPRLTGLARNPAATPSPASGPTLAARAASRSRAPSPTPALAAGGSVVVAAAPDRGCVLAFSAADGSLLAAARLPAAAFGGPTAVALDGGRTLIACGCRDDAVWGLELER